MKASNFHQNVSQHTQIMPLIGGIVLGCVLIYVSFVGLNGLGLKEQTGSARLLEKGYKAAGKTYVTQIIGGRTLTIPQVRPEQYFITLEIEGKKAAMPVSQDLYLTLDAEVKVIAVYKKKRLTGSLQVLNITK